MIIWKNHFMGQDITPLDIWHSNISFINPVIVEILFSQVCQFLALLLNLIHLGNFGTALT